MFAWYYLEKAGIKKPWKSDDCYVIASGDDVVIFVKPHLSAKVKAMIEKLTTRDTKLQKVGLG